MTVAAAPPLLAVLYDGQCRFCRGTVDRLRRWDRRGVLELIDLHRAGVPARFPGLDMQSALQAIQVVDRSGRLYSGVDAVARIGARLPGWRWVAWLLRVPLLHGAAVRIYRWVARNRYRWNRETCEDGICHIV